MRTTQVGLLVALGLAVLWPIQAGAVSVTLVADARIISSGPNNNYDETPGNNWLSVYHNRASTNVQRTLLLFDLVGSGIPSGAVIDGATLTLRSHLQWGGNPDPDPMEVYRVTMQWVESQVTWNKATSSVSWTAPGGDFAGKDGSIGVGAPYATSSAQPTVEKEAVNWSAPSLAQLVSEWANAPATNYGLMLLSYPGNGLTFYPGEAPDQTLWPTLTVEYQLPAGPLVPEPVTMAGLLACCGAVGGYLKRRSRLA